MARLVTLLLALALSGCLTTHVDVDVSDDLGEIGYDESEVFFLWGLMPVTQELTTRDLCGKRRLTMVETEKSAGDFFLTIFTAGLYSPKTLRAWCAR